MTDPRRAVPAVLLLAALITACSTDAPAPASESGGSEAAVVSNRIDIPPEVVRNLGIEFAHAERRRVDRTMRLPGAFESPPDAERRYRAPVGGRINLLVRQYERVEEGALIAWLDSPGWRAIQHELDTLEATGAEREGEVAVARAERDEAAAAVRLYPQRLAAFDPQMRAMVAHLERLRHSRDVWQARVGELEELAAQGAARAGELAEARARLADAESALSEEREKQAGLERSRAELKIEQELAAAAMAAQEARVKAAEQRAEAARRSMQLRLRGAASMLGLAPEDLADDAWRTLDAVPVRAEAAGVVLALEVADGERVEGGAALFQVLDDSRLRFRARGLQGDLARLAPGQKGAVEPPFGGGEPARGRITLAPRAHADARLVDVLMALDQPPAWARPGITAEIEVVWDEGAEPMLAVPNRALIRDGLEVVMFVRDQRDPNKVVRKPVETGASDGRWTVVYSGVMEGSEVVVEGTYELKLTGGGRPMGAGHFHADGTWHAGSHSDDE
jgi:RND family efflux transporter MFP subunit